jgi:hypothetical protein
MINPVKLDGFLHSVAIYLGHTTKDQLEPRIRIAAVSYFKENEIIDINNAAKTFVEDHVTEENETRWQTLI